MKRPATGNLAFEALADRGRAATERNDAAARYAAEQACILALVTAVPEKPAIRAPGMPSIGDEDRCLEHLGSRLVPDANGTLYGTACACVCEVVTVAGREVRVVIRRDA